MLIAIVLLMVLSSIFYFDNINSKNNIADAEIKIQDFDESEYTKELADLNTQLDEVKKSDIDGMKIKYFQDIRTLEDLIVDDKVNAKIAYLSDDDTPSANTSRVLDILKDKDALMTFFLLGKPQYGADIYNRIKNEGHTIANHTYSHKIFTGLYDSVDTFMADVNKQEDFLYNTTGVKAKIVRFPGGSKGSKRVLSVSDACINALHNQGYKYVDWNASTGDAGSKSYSSQEEVDNAMNSARKYSITVILMHDFKENTVEALPILIDTLRNEGYTILPLSEYSRMVH
jgi:peptidoglycan/xylan/chitin deacetylase (PgdA/CDA1 family)